MNKREARKRVREIIRCLEHSEDFPEQNNCTKVAERKLRCSLRGSSFLVMSWVVSTATLKIQWRYRYCFISTEENFRGQAVIRWINSKWWNC